jgi:hypothetical protein
VRIDATKSHEARDERGASLILALIFIVAVSLIVIPLADWASGSLTNTGQFQNASTLHYALTSAANTAIEGIRYNPLPSGANVSLDSNGYGVQPVGACWTPYTGTTSSVTLNGYNVNVWCQTTVNLTQSATRVVTLYACVSTFGGGTETGCQAAPQLQAQVTFDDYPTDGGITLVRQCDVETGSCGFSQFLNRWIWATQTT